MFVQRKERIGRNARIHRIAAIVTGIVPPLSRLDHPRLTRRFMKNHRSIRMSCRTRPLTGIFLVQRDRCTLVVIPLERCLGDICISIFQNLQIFTDNYSRHFNLIGSFFIQFRDIDLRHIQSRRAPIRRNRRSHRQDNFIFFIQYFNIARTA